ncbi:hypothetical protein QOZ80_9BG0700370 [Eleusine coracana subsp. coracana]|nr:hypothetical protein QOZ80_9BG0700370 [Eleusine coracana subsp. coracana]
MILDRHQGLINAGREELDGYPLVHRWCMRHFAANVWRRQKSKDVINGLKHACKAMEENKFFARIEELKKIMNAGAKEWLEEHMEEVRRWPPTRYPLLDTNYDNKHRAHLMVDEGQVLTPLRIHTHTPMQWDERFVPYLACAGFLPLARMGWRDSIEEWLGLRPPEPDADRRDTKTTGVSSAWLMQNFTIDNDTQYPEEIVEPWDEIGGYSWGSAVLAYLYHQLCQASRRVGVNANLSGCAYLLQPWPHEDEGSRPTVAYLYHNYVNVVGNNDRRRSDKGAMDWANKHAPYLIIWNDRQQRSIFPFSGTVHRAGPYKDYLYWLHQNSRLKLRPALEEQYLADQPDSGSDEENVDVYDEITRRSTQPERAKFKSYAATQLLRMANHAGDALGHRQGSQEEIGALRSFTQDIIGSSQLLDAQIEEPSQAFPPRQLRRCKNATPGTILPTEPNRKKKRPNRFTPGK